jgi:hypothetical protein
MKGKSFLVAWLVLGVPAIALSQMTIVFVDGTKMEIQSYEVKGGIVLLKTKEGKLQSVPASYVNLPATEQSNRGGKPATPAAPAPRPAPRPSTPKPPEPEIPTESIEPEPPLPPPAPAPPPPPPATPRPADLAPSPPPVWSNDELQVSLVVPSSSWKLEDLPPSYDVAVGLENESAEARATLALIRGKLRNQKEFGAVVKNVETSISQTPGYRSVVNTGLVLEPYTAHEFRFLKTSGAGTIYNRLVVVYSRDLAYVLSLTCPEARQDENEADFEALVRGLVIKKSRKDLTL